MMSPTSRPGSTLWRIHKKGSSWMMKRSIARGSPCRTLKVMSTSLESFSSKKTAAAPE